MDSFALKPALHVGCADYNSVDLAAFDIFTKLLNG
jgi:hypothetical protein